MQGAKVKGCEHEWAHTDHTCQLSRFRRVLHDFDPLSRLHDRDREKPSKTRFCENLHDKYDDSRF